MMDTDVAQTDRVARGNLLRDRLRTQGVDVRPVPRLTGSTPSDLQWAISEARSPMLFAGLIDAWPAVRNWTPEKLAKDHGDKRVTALMGLPTSGVLYPGDQHDYEKKLTFGKFLEEMLQEAPKLPCYLAHVRVEDILPPEDYDFRALLNPDQEAVDTRAWIGSAGTRSMLHSDLNDNLFVQIWGEKEVVLIPWDQTPAAYPFPDNIVNSSLDLADVDLRKNPLLKEAVLYGTTVRPGDVLFVPRGCWHDFRALAPSVSVNHWFGPPMPFQEYAMQLLKLGPTHWAAAARDFVKHGVLEQPEPMKFFFSPSSTGKRLYDLVRRGDFSHGNSDIK
ncbi:cupin-like domain-containing protein [Streptomyces sp. NPDC006510]|uniref:cupin-like domain-containing protein n=1 Tax=Streptomyces sp. NPDC006510 TaxID=3155600 RepID=UPI0033A0D6D2